MKPLTIPLMLLTLAGCTGAEDNPLLGTLERDRVELTAEAHEPIIAVEVGEGDRVQEGQLLLRLDPAAHEARLDQARAAVKAAEQRLDELVTGPRREQILAARASFEGATARLGTETRELARVRQLAGEGLLAQSALDRQRGVRDSAAAAEAAARQQLLELERGTRSEVVGQAVASLDQARAALASVELSRQRLDLVAPRAGVIDALPYELGERPPAGAPLAVLLADGQPYARVFVPEPIRSRVARGTPAEVTVDGSGRSWRGEVRYVSSEAAFTPYYALNERDRSRLSFLAEVVLTEPEAAALPTGVPVEVVLHLDGGSP